jgi:UDP-N-acetylglucosamine diphosphorylase / glucose-1-phosphate thymidylyltransferase / UDP-N-acetylgalactosamine diphosphorylase / glucosamine-1-phosphate N-acetyltransferase / galactosamine-1-phosphate N-acetyltransferase
MSTRDHFFPWMGLEELELLGKPILDNLPATQVAYSWELLAVLSVQIEQLESQAAMSVEISPTAVIDKTNGPVVIASGASIEAHAIIKGPCYIGKNVQVREFCLVAGSSLEENVIIRPFSEIKHSLIMKNTHIHASMVSDSIIGQNCRIAARTTFANRRLDRGEISCYLASNRFPTGRTRLGAVLGHNVQTGVGTSLMPGVLIGSGAVIYPHQVVTRNVENDSHLK